MNNSNIILGLDVSTTTIGICLMLDNEGEIPKILKLTHVNPKVPKNVKGIESLILKKKIFEDEFLTQYKDFGISKVVIEEPLLGSNNINTVAVLLKFSALVSDSVYNILGIIPEYISSYDARKYAFPKLMTVRKFNNKGEIYPEKELIKAVKCNKTVLFGDYLHGISKKDVLIGLISDSYPNINWIYDKKGELKKENFDASDSAVCCLGYINKNKIGEMEPQIESYEKFDDYISYVVKIPNSDLKFNHKLQFKF